MGKNPAGAGREGGGGAARRGDHPDLYAALLLWSRSLAELRFWAASETSGAAGVNVEQTDLRPQSGVLRSAVGLSLEPIC